MTLADFGSFTSINGARDVPCRDKVLKRSSVSLDGDDQLMDHRALQSESSAPPSSAPMKNMGDIARVDTGPTLWGGIDLGNERASVCVTDAIGQVILHRDLEAKPEVILTALGELPEGCLKAIGVEAGVGSYVVRKLRSAGLPIALLEARKASKILSLRRHKTDASDARGLADIVRLADGTVSLVHQKSAESRRLRTQLAARQQLIKQRVAGEHTIRALLREHGAQVKAAYAASSLRRNTEAALAHLSAAEGVDLSEEVLPLLDVCESIRRYCFSLDKRLSALAREHAVCRRFLAVPGVGPITALSFYSAIDDPHRFDRVEDVGCFLGLTPRIRQSGKVHDRPRISKMGMRSPDLILPRPPTR